MLSPQAPLSMELSIEEYWSGLPFLSPRDFIDPGIELESLASFASAGGFVTTAPPGKLNWPLVFLKMSSALHL